MATGVSATGLKSFRVGVSSLLGTGMMVEGRACNSVMDNT